MVDGSGRQVSMRQPRAEFGAVVPSQHFIASLKVSCQKVGVPQVVLEPCQSLCFTSLEAMHSLKTTR